MNYAELTANQQAQVKPPEPTEKAQIVIVFSSTPQNLVLRFASVKKAEKEHAKLLKAWGSMTSSSRLHKIDGDMFISTVDLFHVTAVSLVDHKIAGKFIPR